MKNTIKALAILALIITAAHLFTSCTCTSSTGMHARQHFQNNRGCEWHKN